MGLAARVGDSESGICDIGCKKCPHSRSGTIGTGASNVMIESSSAARIQDTGGCNCPHGGDFAITNGSSTVFINGRSSARINDSTNCMSCGMSGAISSSNSTVYIGG